MPASSRRSRRRAQAPVGVPDDPRTLAYNREVKRIFNLSLWSLLPLAGLILGPVSVALATALLRRAVGDPAFTAAPGARWARNLALATTLTQWGGVGLMALGLAWK